MPVDQKHSEYETALPKWEKCRDAASGEECVHEKGSTYLPKLSEQTSEEYNAYKFRALYYNATGRTVDGLSGLIFRRPPTIELPTDLEFVKEDADAAGTPLVTFCEKAVEELIVTGRFGLFADYPTVELKRNKEEEAALNAKPYLCLFRAEEVINWECMRINNRKQFTLVVIAERHATRKDEYSMEYEDQLRVLRLVDGKFIVEIHRKTGAEGGEKGWTMVSSMTPMLRAKPIPFIPFLFCGPMGVEADVAKPPILDLANVNLSHYRSTADYEHGLHFTGLPTPIITGHTFEPNEKLVVGSSAAQGFPNPNAKAYFLEFQGQGLTNLSKRLEEKESMMASLGARMLAAEKRAAEAAETAAIHRAGENSVLASLANAASAAISKGLSWCSMWAAVNGRCSVELNTDYVPAGMTAQELTALVSAWQSGAISSETLYDNLQRGEIAQQGVDFEQEKARREEEGPSLGTLPDPGNVGQ